SGSRDEFALDDISITPYGAEASSEIQFSSIVLTATEGETATSYVVISEPADCSIEVSVDPSSTASASDYEFTSPLVLDFSSGGDAFLSFDIITNDDALVEPSETIVLKLMNVTGGCTIGFGDTFTLHVLDNDATTPTVVDIADITTEDANGVAESIGEYVEIIGTVYGINLADDGGLDFYIIDETSGINVFSIGDDLGYTLASGDELKVVGFIDQHNGLTRIIPESIIILSIGNSAPSSETFISIDESIESLYVHPNNNVIVNDPEDWLGDGSTFFVTVSNGDATFKLMIHQNLSYSNWTYEEFISSGASEDFFVMGIMSQNDSSSPYFDGYTLIPMFDYDFSFTHSLHGLSNNIEIALFPNPVLESLQLRCSVVIESVEIYNAIGESFGNNKPLAFESSIDVQYLLPGMYIAKITTKQGITTSTFIKQ
ncbi:MAG: T9SS type A sorting domain-containing protein, partial [Chitinophagales bacterium]|nr:T9SS type A sorting domain-containing protein [Chitinophagales bacterium]